MGRRWIVALPVGITAVGRRWIVALPVGITAVGRHWVVALPVGMTARRVHWIVALPARDDEIGVDSKKYQEWRGRGGFRLLRPERRSSGSLRSRIKPGMFPDQEAYVAINQIRS